MKTKSSTFSIVSCEDDKLLSNGTAFFCGAHGLFVSVAHNMRNDKILHKALIDGKFYNYEVLSKEYIALELQTAPCYHDLLIGRVLDYENVDFLELNTSELEDFPSKAILSGFKKSTIEKSEEVTTLDELYDEIINDHYNLLETPSNEQEDKVIENIPRAANISLEFGSMQVNIVDNSFKNPLSKVIKIDGNFTNGYSIERLSPEPSGYSGGPVVLNQEVIGILISAEVLLSSVYISEKLKKI